MGERCPPIQAHEQGKPTSCDGGVYAESLQADESATDPRPDFAVPLSGPLVASLSGCPVLRAPGFSSVAVSTFSGIGVSLFSSASAKLCNVRLFGSACLNVRRTALGQANGSELGPESLQTRAHWEV